MEKGVDYFAIFGGLDVDIDTNESIEKLIETHILKRYKYLRNFISDITKGDPEYNIILTALSIGDRRTNSAFRKVGISFDNGIDIVDDLCKLKVIKLEKSLQKLSQLDDQYTVSERLLFTAPVVRFWFAFVSPLFQGIKDKNYEEFYKKYNNNKAEFADVVFEQLAHEYVRSISKDDVLFDLGRYWDDDLTLDMLGKTKSGKIIAGSCKYTNSKIKKTELTNLKEKCEKVKVEADTFILFSKKGYTSELKNLKKSENIQLFTVKNFTTLIEE
ncbi:MAG: DUF234 domain-containing protein [Arcobacteraceae bacterium]